jgi:5-methylcytosine-specific restriction endonuclease McrA
MKNKAAAQATATAYYSKHRREILARKANYYQKHKREILAQKAANYKLHIRTDRQTPRSRAVKHASDRKRRVLKYGAVYVAHVTPMPANQRCPHCRVKMTGTWPATNTPTLDHILSLSRGGHHVPTNTQIICLSCNASKNTRPIAEWLRDTAVQVSSSPKDVEGD